MLLTLALAFAFTGVVGLSTPLLLHYTRSRSPLPELPTLAAPGRLDRAWPRATQRAMPRVLLFMPPRDEPEEWMGSEDDRPTTLYEPPLSPRTQRRAPRPLRPGNEYCFYSSGLPAFALEDDEEDDLSPRRCAGFYPVYPSTPSVEPSTIR